jgi:8-hydroxy-5-deazaflavin:NADPH oxidoreductase
MKITVVGAGNVGGSLGRRWAGRHEVVFGVRDPEDPRHGGLTGAGAQVAEITTASRGADVVVLAVPWSTVRDVAITVGDAGGAVLVDATNPIGPPVPASGSGGAEVAVLTGSRRVVKAFNTTGWENLADPVYPGPLRPFMPVAGDDPAAKRLVADLADEIGFEPVDAGGLEASATLEQLARLWIGLARSGHGRSIAFGLLRR